MFCLVLRSEVVPSLVLIWVEYEKLVTSFAGCGLTTLSSFRRHIVVVKMVIWRHADVVYFVLMRLLVENVETDSISSFSGQWV